MERHISTARESRLGKESKIKIKIQDFAMNIMLFYFDSYWISSQTTYYTTITLASYGLLSKIPGNLSHI